MKTDDDLDGDAVTVRLHLGGTRVVSHGRARRRRLLLTSVVTALLLIGGLCAVVLGRWTTVDETAPPSPAPVAAVAVPSVVVPPASAARPADGDAATPCSSADAFARTVDATVAGFTSKRSIQRYELEGCSRGIALAQGVVPEKDSLYVALSPRSSGEFRLQYWAPGTECSEVTDLPSTLARKFCVTPTTTSTAAPARASAADPYGCLAADHAIDAGTISYAQHPCASHFQNSADPTEMQPDTPATRWALCHDTPRADDPDNIVGGRKRYCR